MQTRYEVLMYELRINAVTSEIAREREREKESARTGEHSEGETFEYRKTVLFALCLSFWLSLSQTYAPLKSRSINSLPFAQ